MGFRGITASRAAAAATALFVLNVTLVGIWYVASASVATDRLALGGSGITVIMTLYGIGGLVGGVATLLIVGRRGLAGILAGAMVGWAVTIAAIGAVVHPAPAFALATRVGCSTFVRDRALEGAEQSVTGRLPSRRSPGNALAR